MSGCCEEKSFDGASPAYKRALIAVIIINAVMFFVEMSAGLVSGSQALKADALDFAGDTATYGLSLFVIGMSLKTRARASLIKGASLAIIAIAVLTMTGLRVLEGSPPEAGTMGMIGLLALWVWLHCSRRNRAHTCGACLHARPYNGKPTFARTGRNLGYERIIPLQPQSDVSGNGAHLDWRRIGAWQYRSIVSSGSICNHYDSIPNQTGGAGS